MKPFPKVLRLSAGIAAALAAPAGVHAQPEVIDTVVVSTALHKTTSETALPVTIVGGEELERTSRATLGDTLSSQPGINNASFGPGVGQTVIRGQQGRRVLNMSNSIPVSDASGNSADHAVTIEAVLADQIEVLRGPSTLLYGGGAIGGVVNVIDNRIPTSLPEQPEFSLEARHDSASDQRNFIGRLEFSTGNLAWHFDGVVREWDDLEIPGYAIHEDYLEDEHDHEDDHDDHEDDHDDDHEDEEMENTFGFIENTGGETDSFSGGLSWIGEEGFMGFSVNRMTTQYGLPPGAHAHDHEDEHDDEHDDDHDEHEDDHDEHEDDHDEHEDDHDEHGVEGIMIDMERTRYDLTAEWTPSDNFFERINYHLAWTEYEHSELEGAGIIGTLYTSDAIQHRLQLTHAETDGWHGALGLQSSSEEFGAFGEESFIPFTDITSHGLFLIEDFHVDTVTIELGARLGRDEYESIDIVAPDRSFSTNALSGSVLWGFDPGATLGLSISRSERAPSVEELFSNDGLQDIEECVIHFATAACEIGDSSLDKETAFNTDLTLSFNQDLVRGSVTAFYNDFSDYIYQRNTGTEVDEFAVLEYAQADTRFTGLEAEATFSLSDMLELTLFGDYIDSDIENVGPAPRMPPTRIGAELGFTLPSSYLYLKVTDAAEQDDPGENEIATDGYTRWDAGADYSFIIDNESEILVFARLRNITDEEIRLSTSFLRGQAPEAGRSVEFGVRYRY